MGRKVILPNFIQKKGANSALARHLSNGIVVLLPIKNGEVMRYTDRFLSAFHSTIIF